MPLKIIVLFYPFLVLGKIHEFQSSLVFFYITYTTYNSSPVLFIDIANIYNFNHCVTTWNVYRIALFTNVIFKLVIESLQKHKLMCNAGMWFLKLETKGSSLDNLSHTMALPTALPYTPT